MIRLLAALTLLAGCATTTPGPTTGMIALDTKVTSLENEQYRFRFNQQVDRCFIDQFGCLLAKTKDYKKCWGAHEVCVVDSYKLWERVKKERNIP
jgi:hypothetical protein